MNREYEQLSVDFTTKAQALFASTFAKFRLTTKNLDRQRDENVFQLQVGKFVATLKQQLENIANESMSKYQSLKGFDHCNRMLVERINIYLNEFRQKSKLL